MFNSRWKLAFTLIIVAGLSYWLLDILIINDQEALAKLAHHPDYYMENFNTLKMNKEGTPLDKNICLRVCRITFFMSRVRMV